jgi:hypothetical protein
MRYSNKLSTEITYAKDNFNQENTDVIRIFDHKRPTEIYTEA